MAATGGADQTMNVRTMLALSEPTCTSVVRNKQKEGWESKEEKEIVSSGQIVLLVWGTEMISMYLSFAQFSQVQPYFSFPSGSFRGILSQSATFHSPARSQKQDSRTYAAATSAAIIDLTRTICARLAASGLPFYALRPFRGRGSVCNDEKGPGNCCLFVVLPGGLLIED